MDAEVMAASVQMPSAVAALQYLRWVLCQRVSAVLHGKDVGTVVTFPGGAL